MCQIIVKEAGKKFHMKKLDKAQGWNEDGYGVTWFEDGELKTFKTMDYNRFKALLSTLKKHKAVAHLRNTTRGKTCEANNHPFQVPNGVMFHNGTINGMHCSDKNGSDTLALAQMLNASKYDFASDISPMLEFIIGDKVNKLVFFEEDGEITIINEQLGQVEDGIWYSNDYHTRATTRATQYSSRSSKEYVTYVQDATTGTWVTPLKLKQLEAERKAGTNKTKVFVYGTLKEGEGNHKSFLGAAKKVGKAVTVGKWAMVGKGMSFPYILGRDTDRGHNVVGEVYEVSVEELKNLDSLEGYPTHYKKEQVYISYLEQGLKSENVTMYVKTTVTAADKAKEYIASFNKYTSNG